MYHDIILLFYSVHRCDPNLAKWPSNGNLVCDGYYYGKTCTVECHSGYQMNSEVSPTITCESQGKWSRQTPNCNGKIAIKVSKGGDEESIQSSTIPDPGYQWESD